MKKLFWMIIAVAVAAVSCDKEVPANEDVNPGEGDEVVTGDNDWSGYDADKYLVSFTGTIEETKTTIDYTTGVTTWEAGDKVLVYVAESGESGQYEYNTDGKFHPVDTDNLVPTAAGQTVYVYYPYSAELTPSGASASRTIPAAAERLVKAPMAGVVTAQAGVEPTIAFKNLGAVLHLTLKGSDTLTAVELSNTNLALSGPATITWTDGVPALSVTGDARTVTAEGSLDLTTEGVEYSFLLPPSATAMEGMTLKFTYGKTVGEVNYAPYQTKSRNSALTCERNHSYGLTFDLGFFSGGNGSEENPYLIASAEDFQNIATYCADETADGPLGFISGKGTFFGSAGVHYLQTDNIDLENASITPVGLETKPFSGVYDGGNKTISNYKIDNVTGSYNGAFGHMVGGMLKNVMISGADIVTKNYGGGLVGLVKSGTVIQDCSVSNSSLKGDTGAVGGIVGYIYSGATVSGCSISNVSIGAASGSTGGNNYGGIVGYLKNSGTVTIQNCHTDAQSSIITGGGQNGGIVGYSQLTDYNKLTIRECSNAAEVKCGTSGKAGGIIGVLSNGLIANCSNTGKVTSAKDLAGGIAGQVSGGGELYACWSNAEVKTTQNQAGGIAGLLEWGVINCCHAKGSVTGAAYTAGIAGKVNGTSETHRVLVLESLSQADVTASTGGGSNSGGVIGMLQSNKYNTSDLELAMVVNCVGWKATVKNTNTSSIDRFGAFIGYVATQDVSVSENCKNCFLENCYTTLEDGDYSWAAPDSGVKRTGGFVGWVNRGSLKNCFYRISVNKQDVPTDNTKIFLENFTRVTDDFSSSYLMANLGVHEEEIDVKNASNKTYTASDWTTTGKNGETLAFPLPKDLVDLGTEFYQK